MIETLVGTHPDWVLATARVVLGIIFFAHGAQKMLSWYGGPGLASSMRTRVMGGFSRYNIGIGPGTACSRSAAGARLPERTPMAPRYGRSLSCSRKHPGRVRLSYPTASCSCSRASGIRRGPPGRAGPLAGRRKQRPCAAAAARKESAN